MRIVLLELSGRKAPASAIAALGARSGSEIRKQGAGQPRQRWGTVAFPVAVSTQRAPAAKSTAGRKTTGRGRVCSWRSDAGRGDRGSLGEELSRTGKPVRILSARGRCPARVAMRQQVRGMNRNNREYRPGFTPCWVPREVGPGGPSRAAGSPARRLRPDGR